MQGAARTGQKLGMSLSSAKVISWTLSMILRCKKRFLFQSEKVKLPQMNALVGFPIHSLITTYLVCED